MKLRIGAPDFWRDAKCGSMIQAAGDEDPFYDGDPEEAKEFCNGAGENPTCPMREKCALFALTNNEKEGVWGGLSDVERKAIRKRWPLKGREPRPEWKWFSAEEIAAWGYDQSKLRQELDKEIQEDG